MSLSEISKNSRLFKSFSRLSWGDKIEKLALSCNVLRREREKVPQSSIWAEFGQPVQSSDIYLTSDGFDVSDCSVSTSLSLQLSS